MIKMRSYLVILALALSTVACTQVDTGNVGVEKSFGKVNPTPQAPGVYMTVFDSVEEFTGKEVSFPVTNLRPKSQDNLTLADLDVDVYFKTSPAAIPGLYTKYQGDYVQHGEIVEGSKQPNVLVVGYGRVLRAAREAVYNAVATFPATTMHTQRAEIAEAVRKNLQAELEASDPGAFTVTSINVRNLLTDPAIERAIQAKVAMDQDIDRAKKADELAQANARVLLTNAHAQADANAIVSQSLTGNLLELRLAELQRDTIVQSAKAGNTIISGTNVSPMMQVK